MVRYGSDPSQTFELYVPEDGFSEPGPVFVFLMGDGLGRYDRVAENSDGLIYRHLGKLGAVAGGIGIAVNYRGPQSPGLAGLESGAADVKAVVEWIQDNVGPYGGDPGTIVILGNSDGANTVAGYLFNEAWQPETGHGVAAAVLSSGRFFAQLGAFSELIGSYEGRSVPLALWTGEFDVDSVTRSAAQIFDQLCEKYSDCPVSDVLPGHNHVSHVMSLGTADTSVINPFIRFYHTVR